MNEAELPGSVRDTLARMDEAWQRLRRAIDSFPAERLDEPIGEGGWTRKQMVAHLGAWHESANERLARFIVSGEKQPLGEDDDTINARVARSAGGRTAGEIMDALENSFRRLRRQVGYLSDEQLAAHDGWPAAVIGSNTWQHYEDHLADLRA